MFQCFDWYNSHHQRLAVEWHDFCIASKSQNNGRTEVNLVISNLLVIFIDNDNSETVKAETEKQGKFCQRI